MYWVWYHLIFALLCAPGLPLAPPTSKELLTCAVEAARAAGLIIAQTKTAEVWKTKANTKDLLTEVDLKCQKVIEATIRRKFPSHTFLGEESVEPGAQASARALSAVSKAPFLWVVDPIDGTTNFVSGLPLSTVSIGVAKDGELVAGVVYDPYRDELFTAERGAGAFRNGERVQVGIQDVLGDAVLAAGAPPNPLSLGPSMRGIAALAPKVRTVRMLGSAALMLAYVACGRVTAYFEPDLSSWDVAAGAIILTEAGGRISNLDGSKYTLATRAILASNGRLHEQIRSELEAAKAIKLDDEPQGGLLGDGATDS